MMLTPIPGYEGLYSVTEEGRVFSHYIGDYMYASPMGKYLGVNLHKDGQIQRFYVHRLIAFVYKGLDLNDPSVEVDHEDRNKTNNHKDNLRILTPYQNVLHAHGRLETDTDTHKLCGICKKVKLRSEFGRKRSRVDGLQSACKDCSNCTARQIYLESKA